MNRVSAAATFKERDGTQVTRTTTTGYDSRGRFATSTTPPTSTLNPVVLTETRVFDARFGIATGVNDANGVYVTRLLDGFGRVYGERSFNQANQKIGETFTAVETTGIAGYEKYRQRQVASGGGTVEVYFDELQREVRRKGKAFIDGTYATTTLAYDAAGRKSSTTKPAGGGTVTTTWTYDTLNRLASETMTGTGLVLTSSYAYGVTPSLVVDGATVGPLKSVSITQTGTGIASRTSVKSTNSQGQTVRVTDGWNSPGSPDTTLSPHESVRTPWG